MIVWIEYINKKWDKISRRQWLVRFFIFYPMLVFVTFLTLLIVLWIVLLIMWNMDPESVGFDVGFVYGRIIVYPAIIILLLNFVEFFYSCPTFIDNLIWINRIRK